MCSIPSRGARHQLRHRSALEKLPCAVRSGAGRLSNLLWVVGADRGGFSLCWTVPVLLVTSGGRTPADRGAACRAQVSLTRTTLSPFSRLRLVLSCSRRKERACVCQTRLTPFRNLTFLNVDAYFLDTKLERSNRRCFKKQKGSFFNSASKV